MGDLTSLSAEAIASAMSDYRTGERQGTLMPRIAQGFSEAETRAIAAALGRGQ